MVSLTLINKSYIAAGQVGASLHTMPVLQAYQEMDKGAGFTAEVVKELRRATELVLRAGPCD